MRSFAKRLAGALSLSLLFVVPVHAGPQRTPAPVASQQVAIPANTLARPALWKVSDKDTTIYLFGTVHALPKGISWLDGPVARALNSSQELVTEIGELDPVAMQKVMLGTGMLPKGQTLRGLMSAKDRALFEKTMARYKLPPAALDQFEPWFAALTMTSLPLRDEGIAASAGVEAALTERAKALGHPQSGLETIEYQLGLFDKLPQKVQLKYLHDVMVELPNTAKELRQLIRYWSEGNPAKLGRVMNKDEKNPKLKEILLTNRNRTWSTWIKQRMAKPGTVFVAVGAGHLAGPDSVQMQLARRGLKSRRVQ